MRRRRLPDRSVDGRGYVQVRLSAPLRGWEYEHRLVAAQALGRPLRRHEVVHHRNGDKLDNRPENLEVMARSRHTAHHNSVEPKRQRVAWRVLVPGMVPSPLSPAPTP